MLLGLVESERQVVTAEVEAGRSDIRARNATIGDARHMTAAVMLAMPGTQGEDNLVREM